MLARESCDSQGWWVFQPGADRLKLCRVVTDDKSNPTTGSLTGFGKVVSVVLGSQNR